MAWTGQIFVVGPCNGKYQVGITAPAGVIPGTKMAIYDGTGPSPPTGFPAGVEVDDPAVWMAQMTKKGYSFRLRTD